MKINYKRITLHSLFWFLMLIFNVSRYHMTFEGYDFNRFLFDLKEENFTEFEVNGNINGVLIPPLLLILPVENAFKHSRKDVKAPGIIMVLQVDNNTINFKVSNLKKPISKTNDKPVGTGLKNLERRLQLLYPGKHELIIDEDDQKYSTEIKIRLS